MPPDPSRGGPRREDLTIDARLRVAFELSPTVLALTSADDGRFLEVNDAFTRVHGYARDEVIGRTVSELDLWVEPQQRRDAIAAIMAGAGIRNVEARLRTKHGEERVCIVNADLVVIEDRRCILTALTDITDRVRAEDALHGFLAMLGHELRNPLGTIRNAMALLARSARGDGDRHVIDVVSRQTAQLARLVDDLLDMSRLTSGKIRLHVEPTDLHALARRCLDALAHSGRTTTHRLGLEGEVVHARADVARVEQIVNNLLDNALKYTPAGGDIVVSTAREGNDAVLRVRDTGKGIDPGLLPRVFDHFVQEPQAIDRAQGGLGLGLAVVKGLVELHGGTVAARSEGADRGSEFTVRLPATAAPAAAEAVGEHHGGSRRRVLVVEDNDDARDMLKVLLEMSGHEVETAADGPSGLQKLQSFRPDIALIDLGLPGIDGYGLARMAREHAATRGIRLIALTGYGQLEDRRRALAVGFDRHVAKPVDPDELEQIVREAPALPPSAS
jgi:PAS domain S-box-containing protein